MREERHRSERREEVRKGTHEVKQKGMKERMEGTMPLDVTRVFCLSESHVVFD